MVYFCHYSFMFLETTVTLAPVIHCDSWQVINSDVSQKTSIILLFNISVKDQPISIIFDAQSTEEILHIASVKYQYTTL